jgi:nicotinate-nucleotide pyrophosphorylase
MISEAKRAKIVQALKINPNGAAVARRVGGITPQTVRAIAKQAGIPLAAENLKKAKRLSPEKRAQIIEALRANPNGNLVARQVGGISSRTVQKIAEQTGIKLSTTGERHWRALDRSRQDAAGSSS